MERVEDLDVKASSFSDAYMVLQLKALALEFKGIYSEVGVTLWWDCCMPSALGCGHCYAAA